MKTPRKPSPQRKRRLARTEVIEMRARYARGDGSVRQLAADYGVTRSTAHRAIRRESYQHIRRSRAEVEAERVTKARLSAQRRDDAQSAGYDHAVRGDVAVTECDRDIHAGTGRIQRLADGQVVASFSAIGVASAASGIAREVIAADCNGSGISWRYEPGPAPPLPMPLLGEVAQLSELRGWHVVSPPRTRDDPKG